MEIVIVVVVIILILLWCMLRPQPAVDPVPMASPAPVADTSAKTEEYFLPKLAIPSSARRMQVHWQDTGDSFSGGMETKRGSRKAPNNMLSSSVMQRGGTVVERPEETMNIV